ncbi:MAG: hypothetical protein HYX85_00095 [Chloroflexi bacterium]|nr:hypothetical protein [Chloroflexota bacterium]
MRQSRFYSGLSGSDARVSNYTRGRAFEYRVRRHLEAGGFVVFRTAGSHSPADLIALKAVDLAGSPQAEVWLVQCKGNGYLSPGERDKILALAGRLGVMAVVASREGRELVLKQVENKKVAD